MPIPLRADCRADFDRRPQRRAVCLVQLRRLAGRLAGDQPVRTMGVELDHPIPNDLQCHPADRRRLGPPRTVPPPVAALGPADTDTIPIAEPAIPWVRSIRLQ